MNLECFVIHVFRWNGSFWPRLAGTSSLSAPSNTGPLSPHSWAGVLFPDLNIQQVSWGKKKSTRVVIPWPFDSTPCKCSELLLLFGTHTHTHTFNVNVKPSWAFHSVLWMCLTAVTVKNEICGLRRAHCYGKARTKKGWWRKISTARVSKKDENVREERLKLR